MNALGIAKADSLAYTLSTLLNQLFGKSKEPFWQQPYTNLVRWIIDLHRHAELARAIHPAANRITAISPSAENSLSVGSRSRAAVPLRSVPRAAFRPKFQTLRQDNSLIPKE